MPAVIDTSAVLALVVASDPDHERVASAVSGERTVVTIPDPVVVETCQLLDRRIGPRAEAGFLRALAASGWRREQIDASDLARVAQLIERYSDARLGFVDAAVVAVAERLGARRIYTLDRRDFTLVRPRHAEAFEVLP